MYFEYESLEQEQKRAKFLCIARGKIFVAPKKQSGVMCESKKTRGKVRMTLVGR